MPKKMFLSKYCLLALFGVTFYSNEFFAEGRNNRSRDIDGLAPILNHGHRHVYRRSPDFLKFGIVFYKGTAQQERDLFETDYSEFIVSKYPNFNGLIHLEIPGAQFFRDFLILHWHSLGMHMRMPLILQDIRSLEYVEAVENILTLRESNMYWNQDVLSSQSKDFVSEPGVFYGQGSEVDIYIIDSGIDDHSEFGNRINREKSKGFYSRAANDSYDCRGHGTQVAGVASGSNTGVAGLSTIISYAVMDCETGVTETSVIIDALNSVLNDINAAAYFEGQTEILPNVVINLSNGLTEAAETDLSLIDAEEALKARGAVIIRAAGNLGKDSCAYGQDLAHSLSVGSMTKDWEIAKHSNHGSCVDVFAPGEDIAAPVYSASSNSAKGLGFSTGTSFAAPAISGLIASLMSVRLKANPLQGQDAYDYILSTATNDLLLNLPANTVNKVGYLPRAPFEILGSTSVSYNCDYDNGKKYKLTEGIVDSQIKENYDECAIWSANVNLVEQWSFQISTGLCTLTSHTKKSAQRQISDPDYQAGLPCLNDPIVSGQPDVSLALDRSFRTKIWCQRTKSDYWSESIATIENVDYAEDCAAVLAENDANAFTFSPKFRRCKMLFCSEVYIADYDQYTTVEDEGISGSYYMYTGFSDITPKLMHSNLAHL
eukprot:Awhi_evm2s15836